MQRVVSPQSRTARGPWGSWRFARPREISLGAALLAAILVVAPRPAAAQDGVVAGTVVTEAGQRPLAGAQVTVVGQEGRGAVSDASGRFRIIGLTGDQVTLNVRML